MITYEVLLFGDFGMFIRLILRKEAGEFHMIRAAIRDFQQEDVLDYFDRMNVF